MTASRLLIPTHCTHMKVFLKEAGIISIEVNITFEDYEKVLQYDLKDTPNKLEINED